MRRAFLSIAALAVLVAAQAPPPEVIPEYGAGECSAAKLKYLVGRRATKASISNAFKASKAKTLRAVWTNQAVTMDYRTDRLNIVTDRRNIIRRISCG